MTPESPRTSFQRPEDVARIVTTLATGGLAFTAGQGIAVDAGLHVSRF